MAQIVLFNVSNDENYFPQRRSMFNDARWNEAKRLLAQTLKQHSKEAGRRFEYVAQDIDPIACKMCALNFMVHGMYGRVECRDTLRMTEPTVVYVVNEVKYPFYTPYYSVRKILAENQK